MRNTDRRKQKAVALRERELRKASNDRLKAMLIQKLIAKYGTRQPKSKLNRDIESMVGEYIKSHQEVDQNQLRDLENRVRDMTMGPVSTREPQSSRPVVPEQDGPQAFKNALSNNQTENKVMNRSASRGSRAPSRTGAARGLAVSQSQKALVAEADDWTLLDAYAIVQTEEQMRAEYQKVLARKAEFKAELDSHVALKAAAGAGAERAESEYWEKFQAAELEAWERAEAEKKARAGSAARQVRAAREEQIRAKEAQRSRAAAAKMEREVRELALAATQLQAEQEAAKRARQEEKERLHGMWLQSQEDKKAVEGVRRKEAEEDMRLMQAYKKKLEDEEVQRQTAFATRMERNQKMGQQWSEDGAGKAQREMEVKLERLLLAEQAKKEKADRDRQEAEHQKRRLDKLRCVEENRRLMDEKARQKAREDSEEARYAKRYVDDSQAWRREQLELEKKRKMKQADYKKQLENQMTNRVEGERSMTPRERVMNQDLLEKVRNDPNLLDKVAAKMTLNGSASSNKVRSPSSNNIFG